MSVVAPDTGATVADAAPERTTAEWLELMGARDIPCGRVSHLPDLFSEPHLTAVQLFFQFTHPTEGEMCAVRSPFTVSAVARQSDRPAPSLGGNGDAILEEAGFTPSEIEGLFAHGIVRRP